MFKQVPLLTLSLKSRSGLESRLRPLIFEDIARSTPKRVQVRWCSTRPVRAEGSSGGDQHGRGAVTTELSRHPSCDLCNVPEVTLRQWVDKMQKESEREYSTREPTPSVLQGAGMLV